MVDLRQHRLTIAIVLGTLALSALFVSQGATRLLASALLPLDTAALSAAGPADSAVLGDTSSAPRRKDPEPILSRNIFDSTPPEETAEESEAVVSPPVPVDPNAPPPRCDGSVRLVGAFRDVRRPQASLAAVTNVAGKVLLYRPGMDVDQRRVVEVFSDRVYLQPQGGQVCQLAMFAPPQENGAGASPQPEGPSVGEVDMTQPPPSTSSISPADLEAGIQQVSDREFNIQRGLVDRLLENQADMMRTARIIPHEEGGRVVGVKLYGIRRNSLLGKLGLQNGDLLRTINGYDMTSPDTALEAYARLRSSDHLTVSVVRRAQPMTVDYNIR